MTLVHPPETFSLTAPTLELSSLRLKYVKVKVTGANKRSRSLLVFQVHQDGLQESTLQVLLLQIFLLLHRQDWSQLFHIMPEK